MDHLNHSPGQRILFSSRPDEALTSILTRNSGTIALFTGRSGAERSGAFAAFAAAARQAGRRFERFSGVEAEPCVETVAEMVRFLRTEPFETVVAIGGGSVLDAAKAALLCRQSNWDLSRHFGMNTYSKANPERELKRIVAVPTTAGTGSEATAYSNIVDREKQVKKLICEELTVPEIALVVPQFSASMPVEVTLATGCDALAHLLEGFLNVGADGNHAEANAWALEGIRLVVQHLPRASADGSARCGMARASTLGGMTIRYKSTGLPHLCSFSWFGKIPHGIAAALLLPASWRYYLGNPAVAERTMMLSDIFGGQTPGEVIDSFRAFLSRIGVAPSLRGYSDITPELLARTAESAAENRMKLELAPRPVPLERSKEILERILSESY